MTGVLAGLVELHNHEPQPKVLATLAAVAGMIALIVFLAVRRIHPKVRHLPSPHG
jgi:hypothetical protein